MKQMKPSYAALAALIVGLAPLVASATWMRQTIHLVKGWNGVHIKVNPYDYTCNKVFGGGGIDQVTWYNFDRRDDGTGSVSSDSYSWYASEASPSTFGAVLGGERFAVHALAETNLVIFGTPALPRGNIRLGEKGQMNLVGLNLPDDSSDVSLYDYFRYFDKLMPSPYYSIKASDNSNVYADGADKVENGAQAFWLHTVGTGSATYMGPLNVSIDSGEKILSWMNSSAARTISVQNVTPTNRLVRFELEESLAPPAGQGTRAGKVAVKIETIDWSKGYARRVYTPVTFPFTTNLAAGATYQFKIRPNLDVMTYSASGDYLGILAISDKGATVDREVRSGGICLYRVGIKADGTLAESKSPSGLWVGTVALNGVNRAKMLSSAKPEWDVEKIQDTTQAFQFRLILHAADDGTVKLMKQAFVGSQSADNELAAVIADKATAKQYRAKYPKATIRRVSSANFPFMEPKVFDNPLNFLKDGGSMSVSFTQYYDAKDNPFLHQFHPNHDNLAFNNGKPSYKEDGAEGTGDYESWNVTRKVTLTFSGADPLGANDEWNRTMCGGVYREEITGLNKTPIIVQGAFRLSKTLETPEVQSGGVAR